MNLHYYMMLQFFISSACFRSLIFQANRLNAKHNPVTERQIQGFCRPRKGIHGFKSLKWIHFKVMALNVTCNAKLFQYFCHGFQFKYLDNLKSRCVYLRYLFWDTDSDLRICRYLHWKQTNTGEEPLCR